MKTLLAIVFGLAVVLSAHVAEARVTYTRSYYKPSTGTYVQGYYKTSPNHTKLDNYSTKGNYNPYTGKWGTKNAW